MTIVSVVVGCPSRASGCSVSTRSRTRRNGVTVVLSSLRTAWLPFSAATRRNVSFACGGHQFGRRRHHRRRPKIFLTHSLAVHTS